MPTAPSLPFAHTTPCGVFQSSNDVHVYDMALLIDWCEEQKDGFVMVADGEGPERRPGHPLWTHHNVRPFSQTIVYVLNGAPVVVFSTYFEKMVVASGTINVMALSELDRMCTEILRMTNKLLGAE